MGRFNRYGMFSDSGNLQVHNLVEELKGDIKEISRPRIVEKLRAGLKEISQAGHGEVYDTDVRDQIAYALDKSFKEAGVECLSIHEF